MKWRACFHFGWSSVYPPCVGVISSKRFLIRPHGATSVAAMPWQRRNSVSPPMTRPIKLVRSSVYRGDQGLVHSTTTGLASFACTNCQVMWDPDIAAATGVKRGNLSCHLSTNPHACPTRICSDRLVLVARQEELLRLTTFG
ncbi:hypothetical protein H310_13423 [Aphanomyces invadans]|uniref:Uncharacterized protein n=1 Tax=Aphanomyces invadans TaxID=157072 RepID=A0A024TF04_9STRA|nr:hypothetical protein H310_13423 [Aphanomyces invadans]ETV92176.1 hypothetical protein H310_13423 [Aphanomyces invadans]|eukprot:XP_008879140.1 hypothetical protein H310_13423 [Aphanomyces invadans]